MKTLYVTDMDGTLLNNGSFVSPLSAEIISDLTSQGALITVATARTPATVVPLMADTHTSVPYIVMTGAATFDPAAMAYGSARMIDADAAAKAISIFAGHGINPFIYHLGDDGGLTVFHTPVMTEKEEEFYQERADLKLKHFVFDTTMPAGDGIILFFATGPTGQLIALADALSATGLYDLSCYPDIFTSGMSMIEVFSRGVSKGSGVDIMACALGVDRVVAFGDNLNDLPMFEAADLRVAVANAFPAVKASADIIIGPNYDDSVARFIEQDFLGRRHSVPQ